LLDSVSLTGAYTFRITPGHSTLMEIEATLFTRKSVDHLGLAPLTSMYLFSSMEKPRFDDYRRAVHDSDGLTITGRDSGWLFRSLANPRMLQISSFADGGVEGFGLEQRARKFSDFEDLEARYELRPSLWVEPKSDWGTGHIDLVEIPSDREFNDNIVTFWSPRQRLAAGQRLDYAYWLHWGSSFTESRLARVSGSYGGLTLDRSRRLFIVDFLPPQSDQLTEPNSPGFFQKDVEPRVSASNAKVDHVVGQRNIVSGGYRVLFNLDVDGVDLSELRLVLIQDDKPISETWLYRWTA
jgi:periplasmic glucans biosynthesis protein